MNGLPRGLCTASLFCPLLLPHALAAFGRRQLTISEEAHNYERVDPGLALWRTTAEKAPYPATSCPGEWLYLGTNRKDPSMRMLDYNLPIRKGFDYTL